jgi:hypothetical protein
MTGGCRRREVVSPPLCRRLLKPLRLVITHDFRVPLSDDDRDMECGWRCIPIPPTDDPRWFVYDSTSDRKTVWAIPIDDDEGVA